jgi:hypothetical protein
MSAVTERTPENILLATLHKVGREVRLLDDYELARIFNDAAQESEAFRPFAWHPHYRVSERLSETLQVLDHAGSITRENVAQTYFRASPHTSGPYGEKVFLALPEKDRAFVETVADRIRSTFGVDNESERSDRGIRS